MTFEEKSNWITCLLGPIAFAFYVAVMYERLQIASPESVAYHTPLLTTIGFSIAVSLVCHIVVARAAPGEVDKKDERDIGIIRYGEFFGSYVLSVGVVGVLVLTMTEFAYFWIASALYLAFMVANVTACGVRIVAYRRGF